MWLEFASTLYLENDNIGFTYKILSDDKWTGKPAENVSTKDFRDGGGVQICLAYESHHFSYSPSNHSANTHSHHWSGSSEINVIHPQTECMQGVSVVWIKPVNFCNCSVIPKCYFTDCVVICNGQCNQKSRGSNKVTYQDLLQLTLWIYIISSFIFI